MEELEEALLQLALTSSLSNEAVVLEGSSPLPDDYRAHQDLFEEDGLHLRYWYWFKRGLMDWSIFWLLWDLLK